MKAQQEPNSLQLNLNSAFRRPFQPQTLINEALAQLEAYTGQLLNLKQKINFLKSQDYYKTTHLLTHILIDMVFSIQTALLNQAQKFSSIMVNLKLNQISFSLFKNICLLIQQSLINIDCKLSIQLSMSMIFQKGLNETFKLCFLAVNPNSLLNNQVNRMCYATLDQILHSLNNNQYRKSLLKNVYTLHSGSTLCIQRMNFSQNLKYVITNIGKIFTQKTNLITRNLKNIKKTKFINQIVTNSMKTICNYKNHQFINEEINKITQSIFGSDKTRISKQQFFLCIQTLLQPQNSNKQSSVISTFFLYIDLLRVQTLILSDPELIVNIEKQNQINSSNFYTLEMQKLLKKCPYNGDECCDCKKCQCVRRNRQSAKLSQQKKRNAVQQLDPLKKRIQQLERRNKQLEQQNRILRGIVCELKNSQSFKSAFQSVSKVLNN